MKINKLALGLYFLLFTSCFINAQSRWTAEKANDWYAKQGWLVGCNYIPASAINQLEMWQSDTFDPAQIDKELGWAENIGFNFLRVFLHDVAWQSDPNGFKNRIRQFLTICEKHKIKVMFVFFDDCWYGNPKPGKQQEPTPGFHNSYWLQSPAFAIKKDSSLWKPLEEYVKDILYTYSEDKRIILWDLYNEPGNNDFYNESLPLVKKITKWFREINPSQPMTIGVWQLGNPQYREITNYQLANSDVISYHNYGDLESMKKDVDNYQSFGRPVVCSEYLARGFKNNFATHLPLMKKHNVAAVNWGFVMGKTQTVYPWNAPLKGPIPEKWHHDIFWPDGRPFNTQEIRLIKSLTKKE